MIKLSPATTDRENTRVDFKWFSLKTLLFSLFYFGLGAGASLVAYFTGFSKQMSEEKNKNVIDTGTKVSNFAVAAASLTLPFLIASGIPSISGLALAKDLTFPSYGLVFILGSLISLLAGIPGMTDAVNAI